MAADQSTSLSTTVTALYAGSIRALPPEGQRTGIFKQPITEAKVTELGIVGDQQADPRFHGGPDKALHQFAQASYRSICESYPELIDVAVPGSIGENISSPLLDDSTVCIGDQYRIGEVLVQVSQPRNPCWKINRKFGIEELSAFVEQRQITGWYYRVLSPGHVSVDDSVALVERPVDAVTVAEFVRVSKQHRPRLEAFERILACRALSVDLKKRLQKRLQFLQSKS